MINLQRRKKIHAIHVKIQYSTFEKMTELHNLFQPVAIVKLDANLLSNCIVQNKTTGDEWYIISQRFFYFFNTVRIL